MPRKVTNEDIENFKSLYSIYGTYAEVARQTGFSSSTVRRYIIENSITKKIPIKKTAFEGTIVSAGDISCFNTIKDVWRAIIVTDEERQELKILRAECDIP